MNLIRVFWNEAEKWLTFFAVLTFFMSMACMFNWWHDRNRIFWTIFWSKTKYLITKFDFCLLFITARDVLKSENNGFWFYDSNSKVSMEWTLRVKGTHPFPLFNFVTIIVYVWHQWYVQRSSLIISETKKTRNLYDFIQCTRSGGYPLSKNKRLFSTKAKKIIREWKSFAE